jgi:hypothetical protein
MIDWNGVKMCLLSFDNLLHLRTENNVILFCAAHTQVRVGLGASRALTDPHPSDSASFVFAIGHPPPYRTAEAFQWECFRRNLGQRQTPSSS